MVAVLTPSKFKTTHRELAALSKNPVKKELHADQQQLANMYRFFLTHLSAG
jgi:hypothetical protein